MYRCVWLFRELEKDSDGDVLENFDCWADDRVGTIWRYSPINLMQCAQFPKIRSLNTDKHFYLQTISKASSTDLAEILSVPSDYVCDLETRIWDMINQLKTLGYYLGYRGDNSYIAE